MRRRQMMAGMAAGLAAPSVVGAQGAQILRFVPSVDLTVTDPIYGTSFTTRNHAAMVFDTLYGVDEQMRAHPQMAAGHVVENDGLTWRITLREGLRFHDGEPVLARDCIASLQRWGRRAKPMRVWKSRPSRRTPSFLAAQRSCLISGPVRSLTRYIFRVPSFLPRS